MSYSCSAGPRSPEIKLHIDKNMSVGQGFQSFSKKRIVKYFFYSVGLVFVAMVSCNARAVTCTLAVPTVTFPSVPELNIPQNVISRTPITNWIDSAVARIFTNCVFTNPSNTDSGIFARSSGEIVTVITVDGHDYVLFRSPTPGIGYILRGKIQDGNWVPILGSSYFFGKVQRPYYDSQFGIRFVALSQPMVSGPVPTFQVAQILVKEGSSTTPPALLLMPPTSVVARTCTVITSNVAFQLPSVRPNSLPNVGSVGGSATRTIQLNCDTAINVRMVISDVTTPGNQSSTLTLSSGSTASGVGIQLLYNGKVILYGADSSSVGTTNQFTIGDNLVGSVSIPLTAQYIRTSSTLREGTVKGMATFTMSYQ